MVGWLANVRIRETESPSIEFPVIQDECTEYQEDASIISLKKCLVDSVMSLRL